MENVITEKQHKKLNKLAQGIIEKNQYVSLATTDSNGNPWISPVCYTHDSEGNLYFVSLPSSKHCQNARKNKNVAYCIFDSRQKWGEGVGLQIEGKIKELSLKDSTVPSKLYIKRKYPYGKITTKVIFGFLDDYLRKKKIYKFYKLEAKKVWMNNPYSKVDGRVKVSLKP